MNAMQERRNLRNPGGQASAKEPLGGAQAKDIRNNAPVEETGGRLTERKKPGKGPRLSAPMRSPMRKPSQWGHPGRRADVGRGGGDRGPNFKNIINEE